MIESGMNESALKSLKPKHPTDSFSGVEGSMYMPDNFNMETREIMNTLLSTTRSEGGSMHPLIESFDEKRRGFYEGRLDDKMYNLV